MGSVAAAASTGVAAPVATARAAEILRSFGAVSSRLSPFRGQGLSCAFKAVNSTVRVADGISLSESNSSRINSSVSVVNATAQWSATATLATRPKSNDTAQLEVMEHELYRMGHTRHFRAHGVEFNERPSRVRVYSVKDTPSLNKARVMMEILGERKNTISQELPSLFYPDFSLLFHPLFVFTNSTIPETDADVRLACLLLLALDQDENFGQLYIDCLPGNEDSLGLILPTEPSDSAPKLKGLALDADQFIWAVGVARSRKFDTNITSGAIAEDEEVGDVQDSRKTRTKTRAKATVEVVRDSTKAVKSGRPSARLRRLEARKLRLSGVDQPSAMEAFMIHPPKKCDSNSKIEKVKKAAGVQDYLSTYLREITKIDRLTADEEIMLSKVIRNGSTLKEEKKKFEMALGYELSKDEWAAHMNMAVGELDAKLQEAELARDRMVMANLRLVVSVVKQYNCDGLEVSDLIQEGSIGLLKGVEKFDHTRGYKLSTYVHWWIRQGVTRAIADHSRTVRLPVHVHDTLGRIRRTRASMLQDGSLATVQSLSKALNISDNQVKNALKVPKRLKSLDMQIGYQKSVLTGDTETFHGLVADKEAENHPWAVVENAHMKMDVDKMLNTQLGAREREIIKMHYGVDTVDGIPMSLESISHIYGVSRERVRQLERAAKRKLQITNQGLDKYCKMTL